MLRSALLLIRSLCISLTVIGVPLGIDASAQACAEEHLVRDDPESPIQSTVFSPDGTIVACGTTGGDLSLWDTKLGKRVWKVKAHSSSVSALAFSIDGSELVSATWDGEVKCWDVAAKKEIRIRPAVAEPAFWGTVFSSSGDLVATPGENKSLSISTVARDDNGVDLNALNTIILSVAIAPDERKVVAGGMDRRLRVWSLMTGKLQRNFEAHDSFVSVVTFSNDGSILATGSTDRVAKLWNTDKFKFNKSLQGHEKRIQCLAFSPDDEVLASGSSDTTCRLWHVESGKLLHELRGHKETVNTVSFSKGADLIATGGEDGRLIIWRLRELLPE